MPNKSVPAATEGVPTIKKLFAEWRKQHSLINSTPLPEQALDVAAEQLGEIANQILALKSETTADFAMKLIAGTNNGAAPVPGELIDEAHDLLAAKPHRALSTSLIDLQDQLGSLRSQITLVDYALEGMGGAEPEQLNALQIGMSDIYKRVMKASQFLEELRATLQ